MHLRIQTQQLLRTWSRTCYGTTATTLVPNSRIFTKCGSTSFDKSDVNMSTLAMRLIMSDSKRSRPSTLVTCCWNCKSQVKTPISEFPGSCHCCGCLQRYSKDQVPDYFTLLGQERQDFNVNLASLSINMKNLQRQLHPDLFGGKPKQEQEVSQELSSLVNTAIVTLQNPIQRAIYLLSLRGVDLDLEKQQTLDPEFLSEMMELNEDLESLSTADQWRNFRKKNKEVLDNLEKELGEAFEKDDLNGAQRILSRMKYYENMGLKLKEIQSKFNVVD